MESLHAHALHHLNILALIVSALLIWIIGAVWYSPPLFAKPWMKALGITPDPADKKGLVVGMIASVIGDLVLCFVLWHFVMLWRSGTWLSGAFIGFLCWLGFFAAPNFPQGIYERRPLSLFLINNGYWLIGLLIAGVILSVWR